MSPASVIGSRCGQAIVHFMLLVFGFQACAKDTGDAHPLVGIWEVKQVAVDQRDQPHWLYFPDDPRLLGRELRITTSSAELNERRRACNLRLADDGGFRSQRRSSL